MAAWEATFPQRFPPALRAGAGVSNATGATIGILTNEATGKINGANAALHAGGGDGVANAGTINTLTNDGMISGGTSLEAFGGQRRRQLRFDHDAKQLRRDQRRSGGDHERPRRRQEFATAARSRR